MIGRGGGGERETKKTARLVSTEFPGRGNAGQRHDGRGARFGGCADREGHVKGALLMRFPLALTAKIAAYIVGKKLRGVEKFATVLQLEPLHTCNLTCTGCGPVSYTHLTLPTNREV